MLLQLVLHRYFIPILLQLGNTKQWSPEDKVMTEKKLFNLKQLPLSERGRAIQLNLQDDSQLDFSKKEIPGVV